jgi:hypothetical protein
LGVIVACKRREDKDKADEVGIVYPACRDWSLSET